MIESKISLFLLEIGGLLDSDSIRDIETSVREEAKNAVASIIEEGIRDVEALGIEDATANLSMVELSGYPQLASDTGSFDFSKPSQQMLNSLLKNAKVAKDGHRYKVIPIGKSGNKPLKSKDVEGGIAAMGSVSPMGDITAGMVGAFISGATPTSGIKSSNDQGGGAISFRTATDRQDPQTQWVLPSKEADIGFEVMAINAGIIGKIDEVMEDIIERAREKAYAIRDE